MLQLIIYLNYFTLSELQYEDFWICRRPSATLISFALTRLDSLRSKLEQSVDAFIKARKELEEILVSKTFSLVLNLYNRRKCLCLHHITRLRADGFYYILNIHFWHGFSFQTKAFFSPLISSISNSVTYLFPPFPLFHVCCWGFCGFPFHLLESVF